MNIDKAIIPSESSVAFGILARNCAKNLQSNISKIETLGNYFADYHIVVYENDSTDGTDELVKSWGTNNPHVLAISEKSEPATLPPLECPYPEKGILRIEKMARLRNRIMDEIEQRYQPDVFCFVDIDIQDFSPTEVIEAIKNAPADWGGLFGNGIVFWDDDKGHSVFSPMQYDSFAYVAEGDDYMQRGNYVVTPEFHPQVAYQMTLALHKSDYLPCESAFNGIGIYRYDAIRGERYTTLQNEALKAINCSLCEHIGFNRLVRDKGYQLYIARKMRVIYHHEPLTNIVGDIVYDYRGIFSLNDDLLPFPLAVVKPGIKEVLKTWDDMRGKIGEMNHFINHVMDHTIKRLQEKNSKHMKWMRIFMILCIVETIIITILIILLAL